MLEIPLSGSNDFPEEYALVINDANYIEDVSETITPTNSMNLRDVNNTAEVIVIYHKNFEEKTLEYVNYRREQGHSVFAVEIEDIYNEFNFGKKSPYPIKDFLLYVKKN
jgi:hypothetical protein